MRTLFALVVGVVVVGAMALAAPPAPQPPPVIIDLGEIAPTPAPSPERADRIRLVTSVTVQNKPEGNSIISFEVTDFAKSEKREYRIVANEVYSLGELKKVEAGPAYDRILAKIRDLEQDLLDYVLVVGPPREREPVTQQGGPQGPPR